MKFLSLVVLLCLAACVSAQTGIPPACNKDSTCNDAGNVCTVGYCTPSNCANVTCPTNQVCYASACVPTSTLPPVCGPNTCTPATCAFGRCSTGVASTGPAGGGGTTPAGGASSTGSSTKNPLTCSPACVNNALCNLGVCVPNLATGCTNNPCNAANGEVCVLGACVASGQPSCPGCVAPNLCVPGPQGQAPVCLQTGTASVNATACVHIQDCPGGQYCNQLGQCNICQGPCSAIISNITSAAADGLTQAGVALAGFQSVNNAPPPPPVNGQSNITIAGGVVTAIHVNIDSSSNTTLSFPPPPTALTGTVTTAQLGGVQSAVVLGQVGQPITAQLNSIQSNSPYGTMVVTQGSQVATNQLNSTTGSSLTLSLSNQASANFNNAQINGQVTFIGNGSTSSVRFPPQPANVSSSVNGAVHLANCAVSGQAGNTNLIVGPVNQASGPVVIPGSSVFASSGSIAGTGPVQVSGQFQYNGSACQPPLSVQPGGTVVLNSNQPVQLTNVSLAQGSTFQVNSSSGSGANAIVPYLQTCPQGSTISFQLTGSVTFSQTLAAAGRTTIFAYGGATSTASTNFKCNIQVCDPSGTCNQVQNPNNVATNGRRLLASAPATASWDSNGLTYGSSSTTTSSSTGGIIITTTSSSTGNGVSQSASVSVASLFFTVLAAISAILA